MFILLFMFVLSLADKTYLSDKSYVWSSELTKCLFQITTRSCAEFEAITIQDKFTCQTAVELFLNKKTTVPTNPISIDKEWTKSPGCYHDYNKALFNKRTEQFRQDNGELINVEGECNNHRPCICEISKCPIQHTFTNTSMVGPNLNQPDENITLVYPEVETNSTNQTAINQTALELFMNQTNTTNITDIEDWTPFLTSRLRLTNNLRKNKYLRTNHLKNNVCNPEDTSLVACSTDWETANIGPDKTYSTYPGINSKTIRKMLKYFKDNRYSSKKTRKLIIRIGSEPYCWSYPSWHLHYCGWSGCSWHIHWKTTCLPQTFRYRTVWTNQYTTNKGHLSGFIGGSSTEKHPSQTTGTLIYTEIEDNKFLKIGGKTWNRQTYPPFEGWTQKNYGLFVDEMKTYISQLPLVKEDILCSSKTTDIMAWTQAAPQIRNDINQQLIGFRMDQCLCKKGQIVAQGDKCPVTPKTPQGTKIRPCIPKYFDGTKDDWDVERKPCVCADGETIIPKDEWTLTKMNTVFVKYKRSAKFAIYTTYEKLLVSEEVIEWKRACIIDPTDGKRMMLVENYRPRTQEMVDKNLYPFCANVGLQFYECVCKGKLIVWVNLIPFSNQDELFRVVSLVKKTGKRGRTFTKKDKRFCDEDGKLQ